MLTKFVNENQVWCYLWEAQKESHTLIEWYIVFSYGYIWGSSVRYGMFSTISYPTKRHWIFGGITEYFMQSWFIIRGRNSLPRKLWFFLFLIFILAKEVEFHGICSKFRSETSALQSVIVELIVVMFFLNMMKMLWVLTCLVGLLIESCFTPVECDCVSSHAIEDCFCCCKISVTGEV